MSKKRGTQEKSQTSELNFFQKWALCRQEGHILGYRTEKERRQGWETHRESLLAEYEGKGYRPRAFWHYDHPEVDLSQFEDELEALVKMGLATDFEERVYRGEAEWPEEEEEEFIEDIG